MIEPINIGNPINYIHRSLSDELNILCHDFAARPITEMLLSELKSRLDQLSETHKDEIKHTDGSQCKLAYSFSLDTGVQIYFELL